MDRPTRADLLALAAVIVGAAALRAWGRIELYPGHWDFSPPDNTVLQGARLLRRVVEEMTPAVFGFAAVLLAQVIREPAVRRRMMFRQPGVAASAAIVAALAAGMVNTAIWMVRWLEFAESWLTPGPSTVIRLASRYLGPCVLSVWGFLIAGRLWTSQRNWVNGLGLVLGVVAILYSVLWYLP
jgi:hypothetical protein